MEWLRDTLAVDTNRWGLFERVVPRVTLRTTQPAGRLRLGFWAGAALVAGWSVPHLPADSILTIEGRDAFGTANGERRALRNFLAGWDSDWPQRVELPHGTYRMTLDQQPERAVDVLVGLTLVGVSE